MLNYQELAEKIITSSRLERYGSLNHQHLPDTYAKYLWNMSLSEALYLPLNGLEVALRNRIQGSLAKSTGIGRWWDPQRKILLKAECDQVQRTVSRLRQEGKSPNIDRVVSGLNLGFWAGLFAARYEQKLWKGYALRATLPYAPRSELGLHKIRARINRIRYLRNRIFHHEPIWHWPDIDLVHADIQEMIGWLSPDMHQSLLPYDKFPNLYQSGHQPFLQRLRQ